MESFETRTYPFVNAMMQACQGNVTSQQEVSVIIGQMMKDNSTRPFAERLMRVIVGERDRASLTAGLEGEPLLLINRLLDQLL